MAIRDGRLGPRTRSRCAGALTERDTSLHSHQLAWEIHQERQREIERRIRFRSQDQSRIRRRSLRNRLGHGLIRIGSMLASDGPLQLAARR